ncbi:DNA repair protein RecO [Candidatus Saccharibacteria bacterium]|nr:DNA repair protein RecO [Candidatus Saccharibacteria bacterium]
MLINTQSKDFRTLGYVLRRTNYGEADRILNIITPQGKLTAIAKAARKEKSKLAGGIEVFSLTDYYIHSGRSEFGIITSAKMIKHYDKIIKDLAKLELAGNILKLINKNAEGSYNPDYFQIVDQSLAGLNDGYDEVIVEAWVLLRVAKALGEEINLYRDTDGERLKPELNYEWDIMESAFSKTIDGEYGADEIKMLRLMSTSALKIASRVKIDVSVRDKLLRVVKNAVRI